MRGRPAIFWGSIAVAFFDILITLPFALWIPSADAPELVVPLLTMTFGGATVLVVAVVLAVMSRPVSK